VRVRGLKLDKDTGWTIAHQVAPRAGAWIETSIMTNSDETTKSHPVRVRGLKLAFLLPGIGCNLSHPVRVRGLKRNRI